MLNNLFWNQLDISEEEKHIIMDVAKSINYIAELTNADVFIDGFMNNKKGVVIAHGRPSMGSLYGRNIEGEFVLSENEPTVFFTKKTGIVMRDARAYTQEKKMVLQRTVPIYNKNKSVIAVLIGERDITQQTQKNERLNELERTTEKYSGKGLEREGIANINDKTVEEFLFTQEMHHRIKNNLQTISSILSMQERRCESSEAKRVLKDNILRINNIAAIHEILMNTNGNNIELYGVVNKLILNIRSLSVYESKKVQIVLCGDKVVLSSEKIHTVVMIINELITNSLKHGFTNRTNGIIKVSIVRGETLVTIVVTDDGEGYTCLNEKTARKNSMGLNLVKVLVGDKLKGCFNIEGTSAGTKVSFDFEY